MRNTRLSQADIEALQQVVRVFRAIDVNALLNSYTHENVAFGELKPTDTIPFDRYVDELNLQLHNPYSFRGAGIEGSAITSAETVVDREYDYFLKECFVLNMNKVFATAPYKKREDDDDNGLHQFTKNGLNNYIMSLLPLFKLILQTEVNVDVFDLMTPFPDRPSETTYFEKIAKFLVAIQVKWLRQGSCVDRYLKGLKVLPCFVKRLLKVQKNRYLLANNDIESLDYKLALLSACRFMNPEHTRLFEIKAIKWESNT